MTDFLRENLDGIKTIVVKTKGTPTQKLLAILIAAGIESTAELVELTGLAERSVQSAKRNLMRAHLSAETHSNAVLGASQCVLERKVSPHTPLQKKTNQPANVETVAARAGEPVGDFAECKTAFNGSTETMLDEIERFMGGHCRKNAAQWLANLLRAQGQQAVIESYQSLLTARAEGEVITHPLRWWPAMAIKAKAKAQKAGPPVENPFAEQTKGVLRFAQPAPDDPSYVKNFGRRHVEAARA